MDPTIGADTRQREGDILKRSLQTVATAGDDSVHHSRMMSVGTDIAYTVAGNGDVVLLIHGLGGTRNTWRHLIAALARTNTVIAPDLPGHGDSGTSTGDYSLGAHAASLRDLLVGLGHDRATVVGHSLGGGIAMQFAYLFPDRTQRLVLIGPGGLGPELPLLLRASSLPGTDVVLAGLGAVPRPVTRGLLSLISVLPNTITRGDGDPIADGLAELAHPGRRAAFRKSAQAVMDWHGQTVNATRYLKLLVDLPVLIMWGDRDKTIPAHHHQALLEHLPNAHAAIITGAGHYPQESDAARVLDEVQQFLRDTIPSQYDETRWRRLLTAANATATVARSSG